MSRKYFLYIVARFFNINNEFHKLCGFNFKSCTFYWKYDQNVINSSHRDVFNLFNKVKLLLDNER